MKKIEFPMTFEELENETAKKVKGCGGQAKWRTEKRPDYIKKGIKYLLPLKNELVDVVKEYESVWTQAKSIVHQWLYQGKDDNYTLTLDRINSDGNYEWGNIQFLARKDHYEKDNSVGVYVAKLPLTLNYANGAIINSGNVYKSQTKTGQEIGIDVRRVNEYIDSGRICKTEKGDFILYSHGEKISQSKLKKNFVQSVTMILNIVTFEGNPVQLQFKKIDYDSFDNQMMFQMAIKENPEILNYLLHALVGEERLKQIDESFRDRSEAEKDIPFLIEFEMPIKINFNKGLTA